MKYLLVLIVLVFQLIPVYGQMEYPPAPSPMRNLVLFEYFYDTDPGLGNGIKVLTPATSDVGDFSFNASLAGISNGFHRLYLRSRDEDGVWSHTSTVFFDNYIVPAYSVATPGSININTAEYFIDSDPGIGNANTLLVGSSSSIDNQLIALNVSGLAGGVHRLYIRTKDEHGKWSLTHFGVFDNSQAIDYPDAEPGAPPVKNLEYYFDSDPGLGNGTAISVTEENDLPNLSVNIPLTGLVPGTHTLYFRSRQNPWSLTAYADFTYASVLPVTWMFVKGELKGGKAVINWATSAESNSSFFTIEHSSDGRYFEPIGKLDAAGASQSVQNYSFVHEKLKYGPHVYRIKETASEGRFTYSKLIHLFCNNDLNTFILFPNPVTSVLTIRGYENKSVCSVEVVDMLGKIVGRKLFSAGQQFCNLDMSAFKAGIYMVRVILEGASNTYKIFKQ